MVVVSIGNKSQAGAVKRFPLDAGIRDVIWALDIPEYHFTHTSKKVIYESTREILSCESQILEAYNFLQDLESRRIFITLLENYAFGNIKQIISRDISLQYDLSNSGLIMDDNFNLFVDVGAHAGETIVDILRSASGGSIKQVIAFEPDPNNFNKLQLNVSSISDVEMHLYENACIDTDRKLHFSSALGVNSTCQVYGGELDVIEVDGVALDSLRRKFDFSNALIKLDIEGSELQALSGARRLLQDFKPTLAVSVYHNLGDLWKIILFLKSLEIPYKFALRNYTGFAAETVLYASI